MLFQSFELLAAHAEAAGEVGDDLSEEKSDICAEEQIEYKLYLCGLSLVKIHEKTG